jgi:hypothetical protein
MEEKVKTTYGAAFCSECQKTHYYRAGTGSNATEALKCPECDAELAEQREACGYHFLGSREGDQGKWTCDLDDETIENVEDLLAVAGRIL